MLSSNEGLLAKSSRTQSLDSVLLVLYKELQEISDYETWIKDQDALIRKNKKLISLFFKAG